MYIFCSRRERRAAEVSVRRSGQVAAGQPTYVVETLVDLGRDNLHLGEEVADFLHAFRAGNLRPAVQKAVSDTSYSLA
jgi:hypothetical protein